MKKKKKRATAANPRAVSTQELTRLGSALRGLGKLGGSALGGLIGMPSEGGAMGRGLGASLSRWLGSGDYTVSSNSLTRVSPDGSIPAMHKENQTIIVRHKEFIGEIRGATSYTVRRTLPLNPGIVQSFPWLSGIAAKFQEYKFRGVVYHYVPTSGNAVSSTNAALGTVMMHTTYRADEDAPQSKQELLNEYWANEAAAPTAFCHPIECDPKENPFNLHYVRQTDLPTGKDRLLYDLGTTFVAVSGMQADDVVVGDLWVTYEVELKKPVVQSDLVDPGSAFAANVLDVSGSITGTTLFAGTQTISPYGNIRDITLAGNVITIPAHITGRLFIFINVEATTTFSAVSVSSTPSTSNCTAESFTANGNQVVRTTLGGTTPTLTRFFYELTVHKTDTSAIATVTIPTVTLTGSAVRTNVIIHQRRGALWLS